MVSSKWFILLLLITITLSEFEEASGGDNPQQQSTLKGLTPNQVIKNAELKKKHSVHLYRSSHQEFNFKVIKYVDFILLPQIDQEISVVVDVLWRQKNIYLMAPVQREEAISVYVQEQNQGYIHQDTFYTVTGFSFKAKALASYKISFKQNGNQQKMFIVKISQRVKGPKNAAKKQSMKLVEQKLTFAVSKLQNALSQIKTGQFLDKQISSYVLNQSSVYSYFQTFQSLLVVLISISQVLFITKLLKVNSIV